MTRDDDAPAPEGYSRPVDKRLLKAPPPDDAGDADASAATLDDDALKKAAKATASAAPAAPDHGRPKGAGNALAFHSWKKGDPKPGS